MTLTFKCKDNECGCMPGRILTWDSQTEKIWDSVSPKHPWREHITRDQIEHIMRRDGFIRVDPSLELQEGL